MFGNSVEGMKPGERVAVMHSGYQRGPRAIGTIAKVMKQYVELTDGSRWGMDGRKRPRGTGYTYQWIEPLTEKHEIEVLTRTLYEQVLAWAEKARQKPPTLDVLKRVWAAIQATDAPVVPGPTP